MNTSVELSNAAAEMASEFGIPGVAAGVLIAEREDIACHGVTSVENPLTVDRDTLFGVGSVSKTFTATAVMRLVAQGHVELESPVRRYLPDLALSDAHTAATVTVLNLLNHTSGLDWGLQFDSGEGDDALARYVANMINIPVLAPPASRASYSQAGFNLAGRIIETVTGLTFEDAVASLVLRPLGLTHSFYAHEDVMTRRFAVAHRREDDTLTC
jgi:CubicO group peptidase (beta-lactamase class C family)